MPSSQQYYIDTIVRNLRAEAEQSKAKIRETEESLFKLEEEKKALLIHERNIEVISHTIAFNKGVLKDLEEINANKTKNSMKSIYSGIYATKNMFTSSSEMFLQVTGNEAYLVNEKGIEINKRDGSACRATLSVFMRNLILDATRYIKTLILDEPLTTLSAETSVSFSNYLIILKENKLIILIEQKNEIFSNVASDVEYHFKLVDGITQIRRYER